MAPPSSVDRETVLCRSPELVHTEVEGEVTMMSVETGRYYGLTRVGASIWNLLEEPIQVGDLCERLRTEYRVEPDRCEEEVLALLRKMREEGLVKPASFSDS